MFKNLCVIRDSFDRIKSSYSGQLRPCSLSEGTKPVVPCSLLDKITKFVKERFTRDSITILQSLECSLSKIPLLVKVHLCSCHSKKP